MSSLAPISRPPSRSKLLRLYACYHFFSGIAFRTVNELIASRAIMKFFFQRVSGAKETRTPNIQLAKLALYQLSYNPMLKA